MIRSIDVYRYRLSLRTDVRLGSVRDSFRDGVCIRLSDGAVDGWGEAAPLPGFSPESIEDVLRSVVLLHRLLPAPTEHLLSKQAPATLQFAVDTALREIAARQEGRATLLDPAAARSTRLQVAALVDEADVGVPNPPPTNRAVKLKVGNDWRADLRRVETLRKAFGTDVRIRLDANRRFSEADARAFLGGLGSLDVDFVEEPVAPGVALPNDLDVAIAADETLSEVLAESAGDGSDVVKRVRERIPWASVLVLKPALLGAWTFTSSIIDTAVDSGLRAVIGGAHESGIGVRAGLALAAQCASQEAVGFDSYNRIERDLLEPRLSIEDTVDLLDACRLDRRINLDSLVPVFGHG